MKTKLFFFLSVMVICAAFIGCSDFTVSPQTNPVPDTPVVPQPQTPGANTPALVISLGAPSLGGARATYTPVFLDPPLSTFERFTLEIIDSADKHVVYSGDTAVSEDPDVHLIALKSTGSTFQLDDLDYGKYDITVKAYLAGEDDYGAIGATLNFPFTSNTSQANVTLATVITGDNTGTLNYQFNDPESKVTTVTLNEYAGNTTSGFPKTLTVDNAKHDIDLPVGFYSFTFGNKAPGIVYIYKNLVTVVSETIDIFSLSVAGDLDPSIMISFDRYGVSFGDTGNIRSGTPITVTVTGQYLLKSLTLNGVTNSSLFTNEEDNPVSGVYTRTFTMPDKSVVVSALRGGIPEIVLDFDTYILSDCLHFYDADSETEISSILNLVPTQKVEIRAYKPGSSETLIPVTITSWRLDDGSMQDTSGTNLFTIPNPCFANQLIVTGYLTASDGTTERQWPFVIEKDIN